MQPLRIGLVGPGKFADAFLAPALQATPNACLWSVLSRDAARAKAFAARHRAHAPDACPQSLAAMLADPALDAVLIASPDRLHAEHAIAAAAAGKHVFVEKPMATSVAQAHAMVQACAQAGVTLGVAYHLHWHTGHRALHAAVQRGELGTLRHMRVQWTYLAADASNWRAHADVGRWWSLGGVGTHALDFVRWFMGPTCGEVESVRALTSRAVWGADHDETAVVALRFDSAATAEITTSVLFASEPVFELYGTGGGAVGRGTLGPHGAGVMAVRGQPWPFAVANPYVGELEDFATAIRQGRPCEVDGTEGARNVTILCEAAPVNGQG